MSAVDTQPSVLQRSASLWRRLSRKDRPKAPPDPSTTPRKLQKRTTEPIRTEKRAIISHLQRVNVPYERIDTKAPLSKRVLASDMRTTPFPKSPDIHTVAWNAFLTPEQVYKLVMGSRPQSMEDKWFIFSEGPDRSGKLKVHFHRSWTGMKIAELFILIDIKGEGAGKIVGIKWNSGEQTNGMEEEEVKYMIATTCAWMLGVNIENGGLP